MSALTIAELGRALTWLTVPHLKVHSGPTTPDGRVWTVSGEWRGQELFESDEYLDTAVSKLVNRIAWLVHEANRKEAG